MRTRDDNLSLFEEAAVTVGPVYSAAELIGDPYVAGRGVIVDVKDGDGVLPMHAVVTRLTATPGSIHRGAPYLGQDGPSILEELRERKARRPEAAISIERGEDRTIRGAS